VWRGDMAATAAAAAAWACGDGRDIGDCGLRLPRRSSSLLLVGEEEEAVAAAEEG
jgi:hypothetical protein